MKNDPTAPQTASRTPRLRIMSGGSALAGALSATVRQNNYYQADRFSATFAASAAKSAWWDVDPPLMLDIQLSLTESGFQSALIGEVDHITVDPINGIVEVEGRDLSARLIEAKTQETFLNKTASEVAETLAGRHGLKVKVTKTTTLVDRYYKEDHSHVTLGEFTQTTTEWDLLTYLAQREGFDVFVSGETLYFQPSTSPDADPFVFRYTPGDAAPKRFNGIGLKMERSLTLAKDVNVVVTSWNGRHERSFRKTAKAVGVKNSTASPSGKNKGSTQTYVFVRPNLTEEQAQKLANQLAHEITVHERVIAIDMPGELTLTPRNMVKLQGTGTSFDQTYYVASIDRHISIDDGFRQAVRLKNSSPRTQTQV